MLNFESSCNLRIADSHSHLHFPEYDGDFEQVVTRARAAGVDLFLLVGVDLEDSVRALSRAACMDGGYAAAGIHPQNAGKIDPDSVAVLSGLEGIVAVGETGFDLHWNPETEEAQEILFRAHIRLARELGLPLIIHDRDAHRQTLAVLDATDGWALGGVMHCFSGDAGMAKYVMDRGFYVSVPGVITYKNADVLRDAIAMVPLDRLLVETDAPYLSPAPFRGKRNEPAYLIHIIEKVAQIKKCSATEVAASVHENFRRLFLSEKM